MFGNEDKKDMTFGAISSESVKDLINLLYLNQIDKKLLQTLCEFFYRITDASLMSKPDKENHEERLKRDLE
jgi:hypothetical protein